MNVMLDAMIVATSAQRFRVVVALVILSAAKDLAPAREGKILRSAQDDNTRNS
jgi:hypothetical protein